MFRLSELYFEDSKDQQMLAQKDLEERLKQLAPGEEPPPGAAGPIRKIDRAL